jgi:hypothetical protein
MTSEWIPKGLTKWGCSTNRDQRLGGEIKQFRGGIAVIDPLTIAYSSLKTEHTKMRITHIFEMSNCAHRSPRELNESNVRSFRSESCQMQILPHSASQDSLRLCATTIATQRFSCFIATFLIKLYPEIQPHLRADNESFESHYVLLQVFAESTPKPYLDA